MDGVTVHGQAGGGDVAHECGERVHRGAVAHHGRSQFDDHPPIPSRTVEGDEMVGSGNGEYRPVGQAARRGHHRGREDDGGDVVGDAADLEHRAHGDLLRQLAREGNKIPTPEPVSVALHHGHEPGIGASSGLDVSHPRGFLYGQTDGHRDNLLSLNSRVAGSGFDA